MIKEIISFIYRQLCNWVYPDNRITLESSLNGYPTPFDVVANSLLDRGIWNLSGKKMRELSLGTSVIVKPGYSKNQVSYGFVIPLTRELAGKSTRLTKEELTYEAQTALASFVEGNGVGISFQFQEVNVYENGEHLELRMTLSKNPRIIDRSETRNNKERRKRDSNL